MKEVEGAQAHEPPRIEKGGQYSWDGFNWYRYDEDENVYFFVGSPAEDAAAEMSMQKAAKDAEMAIFNAGRDQGRSESGGGFFLGGIIGYLIGRDKKPE